MENKALTYNNYIQFYKKGLVIEIAKLIEL